MNAELAAVAHEVRAMAEQRRWTTVTELADRLLTAGQQAVLLAAPAGVDSGSFAGWVAEVAPAIARVVVPLEELVDDPVPALTAPRIVAVLAAGRLLDPVGVEAIAQNWFARPPETYAFVLTGAEQVTDPEELAMVERMAWRLLVDTPTPGGDLLEHRCYLWSGSGAPPPANTQRLRRDMDALASWFREPLATDDRLELRRVLHLIQAAEDAAYEQGSSAATAAEDRALQALRLTHAREALAELRRRLVRRLDADASGLERQLAASLQGLEQDLLRGLQPYLTRRFGGGAGGHADLRPLIVEYVNSGAESWQRRAEQMLSSRYSEIASETDTLLRGVDWDVVNEVAGGPGRQYPGVLLEDLMVADARLDLGQWGASAGTAPTPKSTGELVSLVRMAIAGSAVAAVAALLFGPAGPIVVAAGAVGAGGARLLERVLDRRAAARMGELEARAVIAELIEETLRAVRTHIEQTVQPLRSRLAEELRRLEAAMDQGLAATREPTDAAGQAEGDRARLADARSRAIDAGRRER